MLLVVPNEGLLLSRYVCLDRITGRLVDRVRTLPRVVSRSAAHPAHKILPSTIIPAKADDALHLPQGFALPVVANGREFTGGGGPRRGKRGRSSHGSCELGGNGGGGELARLGELGGGQGSRKNRAWNALALALARLGHVDKGVLLEAVLKAFPIKSKANALKVLPVDTVATNQGLRHRVAFGLVEVLSRGRKMNLQSRKRVFYSVLKIDFCGVSTHRSLETSEPNRFLTFGVCQVCGTSARARLFTSAFVARALARSIASRALARSMGNYFFYLFNQIKKIILHDNCISIFVLR